MQTRRVLFYSHDTVGLGHLRRTLKLAEALVAEGGTTCLVVTGSACPRLLRPAPGLDFVKLPAVTKLGAERYAARSLTVSPGDIVALRSQLIEASVSAFAPHVMVVDNVPRGMLGELEPTLQSVAEGRRRLRLVLTMRDILDDGQVIRRLWRRHRVYQLLERVYSEILVFGSQTLFDVCREYRFSAALAARTTFCGYLGSGEVVPAERGRKLLFTAGGGSDGAPLARSFLEACRRVPEELRAPTLLVHGPDMPAGEAAALREAASELRNFEVSDFLPSFQRHLAAAQAVVCMGGYNTLSEVLSLGRRALVVPRHEPRVEQLLRARLFHSLGLVDLLLPAEAGPRSLAERMRRMLFAGAPPAPPEAMSLGGLEAAVARISEHADGVAADQRRTRHA